MVLAAIDIGSNAARLLIFDIIATKKEAPQFNKVLLLRVPLRLGLDVFDTGVVSKKRILKLLEMMKACKHLFNIYEVERYLIYATSALRDAKNTMSIVQKVKFETGLKIEVIAGEKEAKLLFENHIAENLDHNYSYLYIDVGGGSTEISFYNKNECVFQSSYNIGTIRILKNADKEEEWDRLKNDIKKYVKGNATTCAIGSGGNITKVADIAGCKANSSLSFEYIRDFYKVIKELPISERMRRYQIKEDRADTIVPALKVYITIMRWADIKEIIVPNISLGDAMLKHLYFDVIH